MTQKKLNPQEQKLCIPVKYQIKGCNTPSPELSNIGFQKDFIQKTSVEPQCRICLQGASEGILIKPCKCSGSIQYVHQQCLKEWIKKQLNRGQTIVQCEICSHVFQYELQEFRIFDLKQIRHHYEKDKFGMRLFLTFYFLMIAILVCLIIAFASYAQNDQLGKTIKKLIPTFSNSSLLYIFLFTLFVFTFFRITYYFITQFFFRVVKKVKKIRRCENMNSYVKSCRVTIKI